MSIAAWGKKIGMTQIFDGDKIVPVTAVDLSGWVITGTCTVERNGYSAIQVGLIRDRYSQQPFSPDWIKKKKTYFYVTREIRVDSDPVDVKIGEVPSVFSGFTSGDMVDVSGRTRGRGFAGVVKRHNFNGPPGSHGSNLGKRPGSMSFMRKQGRVIKGKRLPGHMGNVCRSIQNLQVIKMKEEGVLFVKGALPGHSGSLVFVCKRS